MEVSIYDMLLTARRRVGVVENCGGEDDLPLPPYTSRWGGGVASLVTSLVSL